MHELLFGPQKVAVKTRWSYQWDAHRAVFNCTVNGPVFYLNFITKAVQSVVRVTFFL